MTAISMVRTDLVHRVNGRLVSIELIDPGPERIDTCDCHHLVWPVSALTYNAGWDIFECPVGRLAVGGA